MNSQVEFFTNLCQRYLDGQLCAGDYICAFEELYIASETSLSEREFVVFDGIYAMNDRFEPSRKLRNSDHYLIDETELRRIIQKGINTVAV